MLAICIPIYQNTIEKTLEQLVPQCGGKGVEIVFIDDHSLDSIHIQNAQAINRFSCLNDCKIRYIRLEENIGRARIRNLFLRYVDAEYMLFLDGDAVVKKKDFIDNYLAAIRSGCDVVCGGRFYDAKPHCYNRLRFEYGQKYECRTAEQRSQQPYRSFQTNNFAIRRTILEQIRFDETIEGYGHEDTLFGFRLKEKKTKILHIENPIASQTLDRNSCFVRKTEQAVKNLKKIYFEILDQNSEFVEDVSLLQYYEHLKSKGRIWMIKYSFLILRWPIKILLCQGVANFRLYSYYKIGLFVK